MTWCLPVCLFVCIWVALQSLFIWSSPLLTPMAAIWQMPCGRNAGLRGGLSGLWAVWGRPRGRRRAVAGRAVPGAGVPADGPPAIRAECGADCHRPGPFFFFVWIDFLETSEKGTLEVNYHIFIIIIVIIIYNRWTSLPESHSFGIIHFAPILCIIIFFF